MGSVIAGYRRPENACDLARVLSIWLEDEFGFQGLSEWEPDGGAVKDVGDGFSCDVIITSQERSDGREWMLLDEDEVGAVIDRRWAAKGGADRPFRPVKEYNRPRDADEFADVLQAMVAAELGMEVVACHDEDGPERHVEGDDPKPWISMSLNGLDREKSRDVHLAILKAGGLPTVVNGEGELELLKRYRALLKTLDLDERAACMIDDEMPAGYTLRLLTDGEVQALANWRASAGAPKPKRKRSKVGPKFEPASN